MESSSVAELIGDFRVESLEFEYKCFLTLSTRMPYWTSWADNAIAVAV